MLHKNLIAGEWVSGDASANINPSNTNEIVGDYARASAEDTKAAIAAAKAALPAWSRSGILERHAILKKTGDEILARKEELGRLLAREEGKTLPEAIGEVTRAAQIFDFFAGEVLRLSGEILPSVRPNIGVEITREAVGVVGIITPWNFPIAIPAWKIAPALAYGNTVVLKPADLVPGSAWALVDILHRAGTPAGVVNLVMGRGSVVGQTLLDSPDVNALTFTGSVGTGKRVALVAHPASMTADLSHSLDALMALGELNVTAAFGPQHGIKGDKQDNMVETADETDATYGIPLFSLYGEVRRPTGQMMSTADVFLFDLQDLGCRIYTFVTTLLYLLEAASGTGKAVWVLDRPNPIGRPVEGTLLVPGQESFVGAGPMPMRHGLTLGEMFDLDALAAEYPDAVVVQTHRDPLRVLDVQLTDFVREPFSFLRKLYAQLGRELTPDTEQRMRQFLDANPGDGGAGRYRWSDTGLNADEFRERVAAYQEQYDVPSEPLT